MAEIESFNDEQIAARRGPMERWVRREDHLKAIEETRKQVIANVEEALTSALAKVREEFERPPSGHGREAEEEWTERVEGAMDQVDAALARLKGGTDV
jgi:hypothetical protein